MITEQHAAVHTSNTTVLGLTTLVAHVFDLPDGSWFLTGTQAYALGPLYRTWQHDPLITLPRGDSDVDIAVNVDTLASLRTAQRWSTTPASSVLEPVRTTNLVTEQFTDHNATAKPREAYMDAGINLHGTIISTKVNIIGLCDGKYMRWLTATETMARIAINVPSICSKASKWLRVTMFRMLTDSPLTLPEFAPVPMLPPDFA